MRLVLGQTALSIPANFAIGNPDLLKGDREIGQPSAEGRRGKGESLTEGERGG